MASSSHCERCKLFGRHTYWNEFSATKHRFFKVMLHDFKNEMIIPKKFTDFFGKGNIGDYVTLISPSGNQWKVKAARSQNNNTITLTDGWKRFVNDHGLKPSDFLVFSYIGDSTFKVVVFEVDGCEKESTHFTRSSAENPTSLCRSSFHDEEGLAACEGMGEEANDVSSKDGTSHCSVDEDKNDDEENMETSKESSGRDSFESDKEQETDMGESSRTDFRGRRGDRGHQSLYLYGGHNLRSKRKRELYPISSMEEQFLSEDEVETEVKELPYQTHRGRRGRKRLGSAAGARQLQTVYESTRRHVTAREKERAKNLADQFVLQKDNNKNRMIAIVMRTTYVCRGFHMTIPREWALTHMIQTDHDVELHVPGEDRWLVGCRWSTNQCQFRPGWSKFVLENNLEQDDVCVFQMVEEGISARKLKGKPYSKMIVHIFRVVSDVAPLKVVRRCN